MKSIKNITTLISLLSLLLLSNGCSDWLSPKPLSFFTPENSFNTYEGIKTGADMLNRDVRYFDYYPTAGSADPCILSEYIFSDMAVNARSDASNAPMDLISKIIPSASLTGNATQINNYWTYLYKGIKDANTLISRAEKITFKNEEERKSIMGILYFHRAFRYYRLVHQYGDVPFITEEVLNPRYDFYTTKRESILRYLKNDLEKTVGSVSNKVYIGQVSQAAIYHLLTKINLSLGEFDDAVTTANAVINDGVHSLMRNRFGVDKNDDSKDVVWDLHQSANKRLPENKEVLFVVLDDYNMSEVRSAAGLEIKRQIIPWYSYEGNIKTPTGVNAFIDNNAIKNPYIEKFGRGVGTLRSSGYHQFAIWSLDDTDYRHKTGNWIKMTDLKYNNPALENTEWYGQPLRMYDDNGKILVTDTIRAWVGWPHYKSNIADQKESWWRGGWADWYVFRLAETYLLRAEAYTWLNKKNLAVADINEVRGRAGARLLDENEVSIRQILDERARELFYEEPRKCELTRIAYIYAQTGITADNGKSYSMADFTTNNFFFDHIMGVTDFYNKDVVSKNGQKYTMAPFHVRWPIALTALSINVEGHINQTPGYDGSESNIEPLEVSIEK